VKLETVVVEKAKVSQQFPDCFWWCLVYVGD